MQNIINGGIHEIKFQIGVIHIISYLLTYLQISNTQWIFVQLTETFLLLS